MEKDIQLFDLPNETVFDILLNVDIRTLLSLCQSNQYARNICDDEYFWSIKFQRDFPYVDVPYMEEGEVEWKNSYIEVINTLEPLRVCFDNGSSIFIQKSPYFTAEYYKWRLSSYLGNTYIAIFGGQLDNEFFLVFPYYVYIDGILYNFLNVFGIKQPDVVYIIQGELYDQIKSVITGQGLYVIDTERGLHNDDIMDYAIQRNIQLNNPNTPEFRAVKHRYLLEIRSVFSEILGNLLKKLTCDK